MDGYISVAQLGTKVDSSSTGHGNHLHEQAGWDDAVRVLVDWPWALPCCWQRTTADLGPKVFLSAVRKSGDDHGINHGLSSVYKSVCFATTACLSWVQVTVLCVCS